jgi:AcrR family transcriptional regulator
MPEPVTPRPRAQEIVVAARRILEEEGREALTMRRLGEAVGIRAPSLYKHFPDKAAVDVALIELRFAEVADAFERVEAEQGRSLAGITATYRAYARAHPHLYRLMTQGPLPRERMRPDIEARTAAPLQRAVGDPDLARAVFAFAHGMCILELDGRFPPGADLDAAWATGITAFAGGERASSGNSPR